MDNNDIPISGQQLVADFQSTMLALATSDAAQREAIRSEQELLSNLAASSGGNYLNPNNVGSISNDAVAKASLDTHIKKVQAEQIKSLSASQYKATVEDDNKAYIGKKIRITSLSKDYKPFESMWFDPKTGYKSYEFNKNSIEGSIEELLFDKNALLIKPKMMRRLFVNDMKFFIVYVINPSTLEPAVDIKLV